MDASSVPAVYYRSRLPVPSARLRLWSDDQLVERFRGGRDEAFRVIHDRYRARLLAYVRQMLAGRAGVDPEDVLQDVFERAARTLRAGRTPVGLRPWLYGVAHNRCVDELRRRPPAPPDVLAASRLPAGDTSDVAERRAEVDRLFSDLRALPELQRSALLMRELQGLSHVELADALDASVPAVKSLLVRARVGLVDAEAARGVPCATVRHDLAAAQDRRVKAGAQAARHLRECTECRSYRAELRRTSRRISALIPGPALVPLAAIGRLLGGVGIHIEMPVAATTAAGSGGAAIAGVSKLAALLGAATVLTTGAVLERNDGALPWAAPSVARHAAAAGPAAAPLTRSRAGAAAAPKPTVPARPAGVGQPAPVAGAPIVPGTGRGPIAEGGPASPPPAGTGPPVSAVGAPAPAGATPAPGAAPADPAQTAAETVPVGAGAAVNAGGTLPGGSAFGGGRGDPGNAAAGSAAEGSGPETTAGDAAPVAGALAVAPGAAPSLPAVAGGLATPPAPTSTSPAALDHVADKVSGVLH